MSSSSTSPLIIGVTNPLFTKLIDRWPHIIRIDDYPKEDRMKRKPESFLLVEHDQDSLSVNELEDSLELATSPPKPNISNKKLSTHAKPFKPADTSESNNFHITFAMKAGLYTKFRPYLQRDKTILRKLRSSRSQQRPDTVQNAFLRRFFLELTQSFIIPLERYFTSLLPLRKTYHANGHVPVLKDFDQDEFFKTLDQYGPQLTSGLKGDWRDLYKHFLSTANFRLWLANRRQEANAKVYSIHVETIANCRLEQDFRLSQRSETELANLILKFKQLIRRLESKDDEILMTLDQTIRDDYLGKLKFKMQLIIEQSTTTSSTWMWYFLLVIQQCNVLIWSLFPLFFMMTIFSVLFFYLNNEKIFFSNFTHK